MKEIVLLVMGWRAQMDKLEQHKDNVSRKHVRSTSTCTFF